MNKDALHICLLVDSRSYGGIETHIVQLAEGLIEHNHFVSIVLINDYGYHPVFDAVKQLNHQIYKAKGGFYGIYSIIKCIKPTIIHTHGYKAGVLGRAIGLLTNKRIVSTFHAGEKGGLKLQFYQWIDRISSIISFRICVSEKIANLLRYKSKVIQNFVSSTHISSSSCQNKHVAFVGRFSEEKGPDIFINVASQLMHIDFSMYGDGPLFDSINNKKPQNVNLCGHVESMAPHWDSISLLCITSREEGLPLAALEAISRGIPVVSFNVGDLSKVVINDKTGWLIQKDATEDFVNAIAKAFELTTAHKKQMKKRSIHFFNAHFSTSAVLPQIVDCYNQAIKGK